MAGEQAAYAEMATALTSHALRMVTVPVEEAAQELIEDIST